MHYHSNSKEESPSPNRISPSSTSPNNASTASSAEDLRDLESMYDSPDSSAILEALILVHVPAHVFRSEEKKKKLESKFLSIDHTAKFIYLKSFRRARVDFSSSKKAAEARALFDGTEFEGEKLRCYFAQKLSEKAEKFLKPPPLEKQFLISPPCSPAEGWVQPKEGAPKSAPPSDLLGFDIAARLAGLSPNASHEVHHGNDSQPSVFVHTAAQENTLEQAEEKPGYKLDRHQGAIPKTPKPNHLPQNYTKK